MYEYVYIRIHSKLFSHSLHCLQGTIFTYSVVLLHVGMSLFYLGHMIIKHLTLFHMNTKVMSFLLQLL